MSINIMETTERALRNISSAEWRRIVELTGFQPSKKAAGYSIFASTKESAEKLTAMLRQHGIVCLYDRYTDPCRTYIVVADRKKAERLLLPMNIIWDMASKCFIDAGRYYAAMAV